MDGLIYAPPIMMPESARQNVAVPALARWPPGLAIAATLTANAAYRPGDDLTGTTVAAWPTVALVGSSQVLMMIIRSAGPSEQSARPRETHDLRHESAQVTHFKIAGFSGLAGLR